MTLDEIESWLRDPFPVDEVKWRIGPRSNDKARGQPLCYVDARAVMQRLDDVVGGDNWQDKYEETPKRLICSLGVRTDNGWVWKSDGAGDSDMEGEKGGISDAFKRAAVKFGIGRYLYSIHVPWIDLDNGYMPKSWDGRQYLRGFQPNAHIAHVDAYKRNQDTVHAIKGYFLEDNKTAALEAWHELSEDDQRLLRRAPTKGAVWTVEEAKWLKAAFADDFDAEKGVYRSVANG